ncbi:hypothetical protein DUNSADRAFT_9149 [Dunaliella salina]|uniref:Uncharacterized protein n=1 Tax=Dunaliella salina TaxID=3046 RepID=A0ABQ7GI47_DUNSA|nr:hypothetical protein DUNSADRAFT_9149 [Dunaliella salina]|eukprot:KAF5834282.1 hypothetical protein DUNSADRAFT_9149 [Dunaliella salina]
MISTLRAEGSGAPSHHCMEVDQPMRNEQRLITGCFCVHMPSPIG